MKFTSFTTIAASALVLLSSIVPGSASPVELVKRDVFVPPITSPHAGDIWIRGQSRTVSWDTSNHPVNITNGRGRIMLRKGGLTTPLILADNFDILLGTIQVIVPFVLNGSDYQVVLFGDSGNFSPLFGISTN